MRFCEACSLAFDGVRCPVCGKAGRDPLPNDPCFLCEKQIMWAEMLKEALENNGIPVLFKKKLGIGLALKVGPMAESVKIYAPYARLTEAQSIADELFAASGEEA